MDLSAAPFFTASAWARLRPLRRRWAGGRHAFTLIELLAVVSVVALTSSLVVPTFLQVASSRGFEHSLVTVAGKLERAQAYAVAHSTYVYVGLTEPDAEGRTWLTSFAANDSASGITSLTQVQEYPLEEYVQGAALLLLEPVAALEGLALPDTLPETNTLGRKLRTESGAVSFVTEKTGPTFLLRRTAGETLRFTHSIQFTPTGEARASAAVAETIQLNLIPSQGNPLAPHFDEPRASVIQVAGLTGQVVVRQP